MFVFVAVVDPKSYHHKCHHRSRFVPLTYNDGKFASVNDRRGRNGNGDYTRVNIHPMRFGRSPCKRKKTNAAKNRVSKPSSRTRQKSKPFASCVPNANCVLCAGAAQRSSWRGKSFLPRGSSTDCMSSRYTTIVYRECYTFGAK